MCEEQLKRGCLLRGSNYSNAPFFYLYCAVCSAPCVYSLVYISNVTILRGDALPRRETFACSYDSAFGFQTGFLLFLK